MPAASNRRHVVLAVAVAVVATVASAWLPAGLATMDEGKRLIGVTELGDARFVSVARESAPGLDRAIALRYVRRGDDFPPARSAEQLVPRWGRTSETLSGSPSWTPSTDASEYRTIDLVAGWPARALACGWGPGPGPATDGSALTLHNGISLSAGGPTGLDARALPIRPLWFGCLANVAFYGVIALLVLSRLPGRPDPNTG